MTITDPPSSPKPPRLAAFRSRNYQLWWLGQFISFTGSQMQLTAILWHIYDLTRSPIALGLVGLARLLPIFLFGLIGGVVADSIDRRRLLTVTQTGMALTALTLALLSWFGNVPVLALYGLTMLSATFGSFDNPARQSLIPNLVPEEDLANAFSLNATMMQAASVIGPALAGFTIAAVGVGWVYFLNALSFVAVLLALAYMTAISGEGEPRGEISFHAAAEGARFVFSQPIIRSTMLLDFIATFFASATTLLPVFATEVLHVGAEGYGLLSAAPAVGALGMGILLSVQTRIPHQGRTLLIAVIGFGLATILFGLSHSFWIMFLALALTGLTDMVSMVIRNTSRQLLTPNHLRGRMVSFNMLFFFGGPQLGEIEAGIAAKLLGAPLSVVMGGIGSILATSWIAATTPELRRYRG
jgi:MFS family permease